MSDVGGVDRGVMVVAGYTVKATGDEDGHIDWDEQEIILTNLNIK